MTNRDIIELYEQLTASFGEQTKRAVAIILSHRNAQSQMRDILKSATEFDRVRRRFEAELTKKRIRGMAS